jgi:integrase
MTAGMRAATSTALSIRQIQSKIAGRASRGIVGEITKRSPHHTITGLVSDFGAYPQPTSRWGHDMPCNHNAEALLHVYIDGTGIAADAKGRLFRTVGRDGKLTGNALHRINAFELVRKRAAAAGITTRISNHSFRATGITVFRKLGGSLENAALMANHASTRTTQLYDRRSDDVTLDEIERIIF